MTLRAFCALARFSMIACVTSTSLGLRMLLSVFSFSIPKHDCPAAGGDYNIANLSPQSRKV